MVFGLELGRPEVTLKTRSVTGSVTLIPAALPLSASRDSETLQVRRVLLLIVLNCDLCSCLFTLSHYLGAVRLACNLCLLYVKFGWLILCILLVIWVENFGKYFQVFWLSRCCQIRWPGSVTRDTVVPFHEIWSVEYFLRFAIELWIFIDVRQHYFQLRSSCETDVKKISGVRAVPLDCRVRQMDFYF